MQALDSLFGLILDERDHLDLAALLPMAFDIAHFAVEAVGLKDVDAVLFGFLEHPANMLGRAPLLHMLIEQLGGMRIPVERVASENHARDLVLAKFHRGQERGGGCGCDGGV
jgi:hypothetical protein